MFDVIEDKTKIKVGDRLFSREGYVFNEGHTECDLLEDVGIIITVTDIWVDYETGMNIKGIIDKEKCSYLKKYDYATFSEFDRILTYY